MSKAERTTWLGAPRDGAPCTIIAEVAQAHDGSLGMAHAYIDAAARAGADAIKFQTHIAAAESTASEPWRTRFSPQDDTRLDYWRRMEFTPDQWHGLKRHADEKGLLFLSSPFSAEAVDLLKQVGVAGWKIASGEVTNFPMLDMMASTGQPVMLSTGMSPWPEIDAAVERVRRGGAPLAILQCATQYPSPPEMIGLNLIAEFRDRYKTAVGLSDHSGTIYPGIAAATFGIEVLEIHITMSREMFGPDVVASVTSEELRQLVDGVRFVEAMAAHPVDKTTVADHVAPLRDIFLKSVVPLADLAAGTVLQRDHLGFKKPGTGIPASEYESVVGRKLSRNVKRDVPLVRDDLETH
jgi:N-acetylneuraminate synthase